METKDVIGLALLFASVGAGVLVCTVSTRARDAAFFLLVAASVITDKLDINFLSHFWYRGTTRGIEVSFVDVFAISVLFSSLLLPRREEQRFFWPGSLGCLLLFFLYATISVVLSEPRIYGLFELSKILRGILVFLAAAMFIRGERELRILVWALCFAVCFEGALAVKQRALDGIYRVTGSIEHANSFSMYLCAVAPVLLAAASSAWPRLLRWFAMIAVAAATLSILLTVSRAGIPVFAMVMLGTIVFCVSWKITFKKVAITAVVLIGLAGMLAKSWDTLMARYGEATLQAEYIDNTEGRGYYLRLARAIIADNPMGVGLNNWSYWVSKEYGARLGTRYHDYDAIETLSVAEKEKISSDYYAAPAHNLLAITVAELGIPGLLLFALLWARWFGMGFMFLWSRSLDPLRQIAVGVFFGTWGVFLQSVTEWTYRQTHILFTLHILLGALASLAWLRRQARRQARQTVVNQPQQHWERDYEPVGV